MRLVMLTGDHKESAALVAKEVGLTQYLAELRPEDKLEYISKEENLVMVGDGINDAPALARATVGISMGKVGSTVAIDASDIVLLQDKIELLEWLIKKIYSSEPRCQTERYCGCRCYFYGHPARSFGMDPSLVSSHFT